MLCIRWKEKKYILVIIKYYKTSQSTLEWCVWKFFLKLQKSSHFKMVGHYADNVLETKTIMKNKK